jgi:hypothetical protein
LVASFYIDNVEYLLLIARSDRSMQNRIYRFFPRRGWDDFA